MVIKIKKNMKILLIGIIVVFVIFAVIALILNEQTRPMREYNEAMEYGRTHYDELSPEDKAAYDKALRYEKKLNETMDKRRDEYNKETDKMLEDMNIT